MYLEAHPIGTGLAAPCDVILSETDRELKRKRYEHFRVREYWLVDPDANSVEILGLQADRFVRLNLVTPPASCTSPLFPHLENQSQLALEIVRVNVFQPHLASNVFWHSTHHV